MKVRVGLCAALAAVVVVYGAAAEPSATKQRVAITMKFHSSTFVLMPLEAGDLKRDSGRLSESGTSGSCRDLIRDGQKAEVCPVAWRLAGKRGTLSIRASQEWVNPGSPGCGVAFGTWKVARATGDYAGMTGGGRSAYDAHCERWYGRHEGYLTSP